jgi:hypothetical protein
LQDAKLFETILGITAPWQVARVELKTEQDVDLVGRSDMMAMPRLRHGAGRV